MYAVERIKEDGASQEPREWWTGKAGYGRSPLCTSSERDAGVWAKPEQAIEAFAGWEARDGAEAGAGLIAEEYHGRLRVRAATRAMVEAERVRRAGV